MLGDNIMESDIPLTKQLMDLQEKNGAENVAVVEVPTDKTNEFGIIDIERKAERFNDGTVYNALKFIKKPEPADAPSNLGIAGRYCAEARNL